MAVGLYNGLLHRQDFTLAVFRPVFCLLILLQQLEANTFGYPVGLRILGSLAVGYEKSVTEQDEKQVSDEKRMQHEHRPKKN